VLFAAYTIGVYPTCCRVDSVQTYQTHSPTKALRVAAQPHRWDMRQQSEVRVLRVDTADEPERVELTWLMTRGGVEQCVADQARHRRQCMAQQRARTGGRFDVCGAMAIAEGNKQQQSRRGHGSIVLGLPLVYGFFSFSFSLHVLHPTPTTRRFPLPSRIPSSCALAVGVVGPPPVKIVCCSSWPPLPALNINASVRG
jgi:hypothetical protein